MKERKMEGRGEARGIEDSMNILSRLVLYVDCQTDVDLMSGDEASSHSLVYTMRVWDQPMPVLYPVPLPAFPRLILLSWHNCSCPAANIDKDPFLSYST
jgi:hypothetical protein